MKNLYPISRRLLYVLIVLVLLSTQQTAPPLLAQSAAITSPAPGSSVSSGAVPVMGTATIDPFQRYELYYKQEPSGDEAYIYFDGGTREVVNGQLGVWQTGDLAPGTYTLRMRVVKTDGNYSEHFAPDLIVNQQPPTETPTPTPDEPTSTPIPIETPTPLPQPTPAAVDVQQPDLGETPVAEPTPTAPLVALGSGSDNSTGGNELTGGGSTEISTNTVVEAVDNEASSGFTAELGAALSIERLRERFFTGARFSAAIFLIIFAIFAAKRLLEWTLSRAG